MTTENDKTTRRVLSLIQAVEDQLDDFDDTLDVPVNLMKTLNRFRKTKNFVPRVLKADDNQSVRKAQESLHQIQGAFDKVIHIHFSVRRRIELLLQVEIQAKHVLLRAGVLPDTASGPRVHNCIAKWVPRLAEHQARWGEMDKLCGMIQAHLGRAMKVIELQMKLDDNVRWAQYRS